MEENKLTIKLEDYLQTRDKMKDNENLINMIIDYILSYAELENEKLTIDYNIRYSKFLEKVIKEKFPEKYDKRLKELKEENN